MPPNPSRVATVEELIHLGQHRRMGFGFVSEGTGVRMEIEAQLKMLSFADRLGWTEAEKNLVAANRWFWEEELMDLLARGGK